MIHNKRRRRKPRKKDGDTFLRCLLGTGKGVSSKRLVLIVACLLYVAIVLASVFGGKKVDSHILNSLVVIIGVCIGSVAATNFIKNK